MMTFTYWSTCYLFYDCDNAIIPVLIAVGGTAILVVSLCWSNYSCCCFDNEIMPVTMHCDTDVCCTTIKQYIYICWCTIAQCTLHSYDVTIRMFPFVTMQLQVCWPVTCDWYDKIISFLYCDNGILPGFTLWLSYQLRNSMMHHTCYCTVMMQSYPLHAFPPHGVSQRWRKEKRTWIRKQTTVNFIGVFLLPETKCQTSVADFLKEGTHKRVAAISCKSIYIICYWYMRTVFIVYVGTLSR